MILAWLWMTQPPSPIPIIGRGRRPVDHLCSYLPWAVDHVFDVIVSSFHLFWVLSVAESKFDHSLLWQVGSKSSAFLQRNQCFQRTGFHHTDIRCWRRGVFLVERKKMLIRRRRMLIRSSETIEITQSDVQLEDKWGVLITESRNKQTLKMLKGHLRSLRITQEPQKRHLIPRMQKVEKDYEWGDEGSPEQHMSIWEKGKRTKTTLVKVGVQNKARTCSLSPEVQGTKGREGPHTTYGDGCAWNTCSYHTIHNTLAPSHCFCDAWDGTMSSGVPGASIPSRTSITISSDRSALRNALLKERCVNSWRVCEVETVFQEWNELLHSWLLEFELK